MIWRIHDDNGTPLSIYVTGYNPATQTTDHYTFSLGSGVIHHSGACSLNSKEVRWSGRDSNGVSSDVTYRVDGEQIHFTWLTGEAGQAQVLQGFLQRTRASPLNPQARDPFTAFYGDWSFDSHAELSDGTMSETRGGALIAPFADIPVAVELYFADSSGTMVQARLLTHFDATIVRYWIDPHGKLWMLSGRASGQNQIDWEQALAGDPAVTAVDAINPNGVFRSQFEQMGVDGQKELTITTVHRRIQH